jgi:hypothetical protein
MVWELEFEYEETGNNHDGYCSDPGDNYDIAKRWTKKYPANILFIHRNVNDDGTVNLDNYRSRKDFRPYILESSTHGWCGCGCGTVINIISGKLCKIKNIKKKYMLQKLTESEEKNKVKYHTMMDFIVTL